MYALLFRLVLARFDPEFAHHAGMAVVRVLGVPPFSWIARSLTRPSPDDEVRTLGLTFPTPFGIAAGFDKNAVGVRGLSALGFGHIEVGTITAIPQPGNPKPRLFRLSADRAVVNRMGFNNAGAEAAEKRLWKLRRRRPSAVIGVNIGKSRVVAVEDATADYVASAVRLAPLLRAVKAAAGATPLLVKIAPDLPDDEVTAIAELAVAEGLDGLIATTTTISREGLVTDPA
jgi:dihydroorotate dehydrogenase